MRALDVFNWKQSREPSGDIQVTNVNLANILTFARILLIPVFVVLFSRPTPERSAAAALVFTIAALTDILDGYVARRRSQITRLGRLLDPIADKLLVLAGLVLLVEFQRVDAWVAIVILGREIAVTGVRAIAAAEGVVLSAEQLGKYKVVLQIMAIVLLILNNTPLLWSPLTLHALGTLLLYAAMGLGLLSAIRYISKLWHELGIRPV